MAKLELKHDIGHLEAILEPNPLDEFDTNNNQSSLKMEMEQNKDANPNSSPGVDHQKFHSQPHIQQHRAKNNKQLT